MQMTAPDFIGYIGVACVVGTYFLSQTGRMDSTQPLYPAINAVGAAMILVSLCYRPNPPSIVIELFWFGISIVGLTRALAKKR
ncbi:MAG: hypothetical protein K2Q06_12255 [Parvularculaceae bacterium]|nr:hypothetical protein [Parvularculaceae bacterium]